MVKAELTERQKEIFTFIKNRVIAGLPPTFREIGKEFNIGSPNGVACHLKALKRKGVIDYGDNKSRSIKIVGLREWKKDIPKVPGYYWWRNTEGEGNMTYITIHDDVTYVSCFERHPEPVQNGDWQDGEWNGPIYQPE